MAVALANDGIIAGKGGAVFTTSDTSASVSDCTSLGDINTYTLSINGDTHEATAFSPNSAQTNAKAFVAGTYGWAVVANGFMRNETARISVGTSYRLLLRQADVTATTDAKKYQFKTGIGICNGNEDGMDVNGVATRNFTFQGTGSLGTTYSAIVSYLA